MSEDHAHVDAFLQILLSDAQLLHPAAAEEEGVPDEAEEERGNGGHDHSEKVDVGKVHGTGGFG
jgi:hypothetical protein